MARTLKANGSPLAFCVPSGNFGNLTGGLLGARMGIPVAKFIAAVNANAVMPEFLRTGILNTRPSVQTLSNAMDVGNPSNIARIFDLYAIDKTLPASDRNIDRERLQSDIWSASVDDKTTLETIQRVYREYHYIMDPHTAVGWRALELWRETEEGRNFQGHTVLVSTAHPAKFMDTLLLILVVIMVIVTIRIVWILVTTRNYIGLSLFINGIALIFYLITIEIIKHL